MNGAQYILAAAIALELAFTAYALWIVWEAKKEEVTNYE